MSDRNERPNAPNAPVPPSQWPHLGDAARVMWGHVERGPDGLPVYVAGEAT